MFLVILSTPPDSLYRVSRLGGPDGRAGGTLRVTTPSLLTIPLSCRPQRQLHFFRREPEGEGVKKRIFRRIVVKLDGLLLRPVFPAPGRRLDGTGNVLPPSVERLE